jgi:hypothetical protein
MICLAGLVVAASIAAGAVVGCGSDDESVATTATPSGGQGGQSTSTGGAGGGGAEPIPDVDRYEPVEIELTSSGTYDNPYLDVELSAEVTPPAGSGEEPYTVPGFWDGGSTWRIRWAPRNAGRYQITTQCSDTSDDGLHDVSFETLVSDAYSAEWAPNGFIRIDADSTYYFEHDDESRFLWVGDTNWINLYEHAWDQPMFPEADWQTLCDQRAAYGFTVLQAVVYNHSEHWDDGEYPFGGDQGVDHDVVNPISWQRVDGRVQYAVQQGLVAYLMTSSNGRHFEWPEEQRERLYRYIVARYAAYNVGFGGGEEVDRGGFGTDAKYRHMIDSLHGLDPYRRMVGLHATGTGVKVVPEDVDFLLIQYYTSSISFDESEAASRDNGKPFVNGETYYFDNGQPGMDDPVTIRRMAWRIYLGGAAGYTYGHMGIAVATGSSHPSSYDLSDLTDESAEEMRKISAWMQQPGVRYWTWSRFEDLGSGRHLSAAPGSQYVIHNEGDAGSFDVDLSDATGTLTGTWYDIAADAQAGTESISPGASVTIDPPGAWHVLLLDT